MRRCQMNVSLTPELENLVNQKLKSGMYSSASEVIRAALRLMAEQDQLKQVRLNELRADLSAGLEQAKNDETVSGKDVFKRLRSKKD
jgi:antitoxin ParD1/3/4